MKALTQRQVSNRLAKLELWAECGDAIQRTFHFADFVTSMKFVNEIAQAAERVQARWAEKQRQRATSAAPARPAGSARPARSARSRPRDQDRLD